jgi:hypothetical protein
MGCPGQSHCRKHAESKEGLTRLATKQRTETRSSDNVERRHRQESKLLIEEQAGRTQRDPLEENPLVSIGSERIWISQKDGEIK